MGPVGTPEFLRELVGRLFTRAAAGMLMISSTPLSAPTYCDVTAVGDEALPASTPALRVLVVDDDRTLREGCVAAARMAGHDVTSAGTGNEAVETLRRRRFDVVILDLYLTPTSGMDVLRAALAADRDLLVIVMTGRPSVASSIEALRAGAWDYLPKPFSATHLQLLLGRAAHTAAAARAARRADVALVERVGNSDRMMLLGIAPAFRRAVELARKVAVTDAAVMILGESGTGKELFAQFIHRHGSRAQRDLVAVNCAAFPENLLESEMFGHRKGAFTGADRDKPGLLEVADGGTMFLDEVAEMSLPLQAKLLRVLQDGVVRRVGSERPDATVNVRVISATNRDPSDAVRQGGLREDLFYRLQVVPISIPPLRERPEDIPILANHFLLHYWGRYRRPTEPVPELSASALDFLRTRTWPGNVRELQNVIEHLAVVATPGRPVKAEDISIRGDQAFSAGGATIPTALMNQGYHAAKDAVLMEFEKAYLSRLLERSRGNLSRAAKLADVNRATLYRLVERHPQDGREQPLDDL
ncbi:MAG: sigma-54-dependent transcriptional regulator [Gemmatimonadaceae bacterium]